MFLAYSFFLLISFAQLSTSFSFDSQSCRMKCESLFADSPTKLSLCLRTCSPSSIPTSPSANSKTSSTTTSQKSSSKPQYANMYVYDRASNRYSRQKVIVLSSTTTTTKTTSSHLTSTYNSQNKFDNISKCLKDCNGDLDNRAIREKGVFTKWMKCRQYCFADTSSSNQESSEFPFFDDSDNQEICDQECDRYWKGTVHWKPCRDQCQNIDQKKQSDQLNNSPKNSKESIYDIW